MQNVGWLKSDKSNTELYTPYYAVLPLLKYIPKDKIIWCPFDQYWSAFYNVFVNNGYTVIRSSIQEGQDFFLYEPPYYDIIISNPPFDIKDQILARLYQLGKPFAMLLPLNSLQGKTRYELFTNGIQLLSFDDRIAYHNPYNMVSVTKGTPFASAYFCRNLLPNDLIVEQLNKDNNPLRYNEIMARRIMCKRIVV